MPGGLSHLAICLDIVAAIYPSLVHIHVHVQSKSVCPSNASTSTPSTPGSSIEVSLPSHSKSHTPSDACIFTSLGLDALKYRNVRTVRGIADLVMLRIDGLEVGSCMLEGRLKSWWREKREGEEREKLPSDTSCSKKCNKSQKYILFNIASTLHRNRLPMPEVL